MLPSSMRRVISTAPQSPALSPFAAAATATIPRVSSLAYKASSHQRRYSSSKPSSPNDDSKNFPAGGSVPASASSKPTAGDKSASEKPAGEKRKRKAKDTAADSAKQLPRVPSTQHVPGPDIALSNFFSLHRPLSVHHTVPKPVTDEAFASIFTVRARSSRSTSRATQSIEQSMADMTLDGPQNGPDGAADGLTKIELKHRDGGETSLYLEISSQFLPFSPPPIPQPQTGSKSSDAVMDPANHSSAQDQEAAAEDQQLQPNVRSYKVILTIDESTGSDGQMRIAAHSPEVVEYVPPPRTFLGRMAQRQMRYDALQGMAEYNGRMPSMLAISVRRQKKLKMKKKKYKKLMKRTRLLRQKLQKT